MKITNRIILNAHDVVDNPYKPWHILFLRNDETVFNGISLSMSVYCKMLCIINEIVCEKVASLWWNSMVQLRDCIVLSREPFP